MTGDDEKVEGRDEESRRRGMTERERRIQRKKSKRNGKPYKG